jgi:hypothetical protein
LSVQRGNLAIIKNALAAGAHFSADVTFDRLFVSPPDVFVTSDEVVFVVSAP